MKNQKSSVFSQKNSFLTLRQNVRKKLCVFVQIDELQAKYKEQAPLLPIVWINIIQKGF